ncbi:flap endonuclease GEN-like protein 1 [Chlorella sorokiniana]|uniref:Flap endonuclease GEN-like protein 1 n=1 Tax=Chlorella sorokiniana TaxID=3076 RepID=A0A2P6TI41_CHLSO|nr:flap endonuclease GEN-like protein 1 [Chlorella sorokiniana]|eukprot:PRW33965.1 flap endonuclease GEN-like protein 1 [Chlorella sorokiniana]
MGVNALWQLLRAEGLVEHYAGAAPADHAAIVEAVDGAAIAVDLSTWIMQADQQQALLPHFSKEERCMKIAFERALQWLRHGCLPVIVVEGEAPEEKRAEQQRRFASRNGYAGGGSQRGNSQFQRLGRTVGGLLERLGVPVFYAPGEAEAVCAALSRAGCVDGCGSNDSDCLVYGAEAVYHTLKLSTILPRECEMKRVRLSSIRRRLELQSGGARALCVLGVLSGSDYDLDGAAGVGSAGGLALARHLLQGDTDDSRVLERLAEAVQQPTNQHLLDLKQCTGCQACGHEGGKAGKIKRHSSRNVCPCCPPTETGHCRDHAFERCQCAFHRLETERRAERILERVRKSPGFLEEAQAAIAVFERQGVEADAYVRRRLAELGGRTGERLRWLRRPSVQGVFDVLDSKRRQLLWSLADVRSKLLPVLLEWDLKQQGLRQAGEDGAGEVEFQAAEIQKVHGHKAKLEALTAAHWRYVVRWERLDRDLEPVGLLEVRAKKPRGKAAAVAAAAAEGAEEGEEGGGPPLSQAAGGGTGDEEAVETLTLREFDARWMKEQPAEHRAVRISAVHALLPALEDSYQQRLAGGGPGSAGKKRASKASGKAAAGSGGRGRGGGKAAAGAAGGAGATSAGGSLRSADVLRELQSLMAEEAAAEPQAQHAQRQRQQERQQPAAKASGQTDGDITRFMPQRKATGETPSAALQSTASAAAVAAAAAAPKHKPSGAAAAAAAGKGYGLASGSGAASGKVRQALGRPQTDAHLPGSAAEVQSLLGRVMGPPAQQRPQQAQQQQQKPQRPPPAQQASPQKRLRSPHSSPPGAAAAGAGDSPVGSPGFEIVLSSPESPGQQRQLGGGRVRPREESASPPPLSQRMLQAAQMLQQEAAAQLEQQQQVAEAAELGQQAQQQQAGKARRSTGLPRQQAQQRQQQAQQRQQLGSPIDLTFDSD